MSARDVLRAEFERAAPTFSERTRGRFDEMRVVEFAGVQPGATVLEVGAGTGQFLSLFDGVAGLLLGVDLTEGMLRAAASEHPGMALALADGGCLPLKARSVDLATTAQALHHIHEPVPVLKELRRVARPEGGVLVVDQVAPERYEEAVAMNELEVLRDPSHAASRPPSAFRMLLRAVGLEIVDERIVEATERLSSWMWPGEFPEERIEAVRAFIEQRGVETGMGFERDGDDWLFVRRRIMLLARRP